MHFRKAARDRTKTLASLGLQYLNDTKILLHCFGGHALNAPADTPLLPEGWAYISQTIDIPPLFHKVSHDVHMPDLIEACDAVLGKLGWGTCSEVIGNGYKPFHLCSSECFHRRKRLAKLDADCASENHPS